MGSTLAELVLVTWSKWPPLAYIVKPFKIIFLNKKAFVCSVGYVGPTKFVQIIILG